MIFDPAFYTCLKVKKVRLDKLQGTKTLFSPGHSLVMLFITMKEDQVLIAGDLFTATRGGKLRPPMKGYTQI